MFAGITFGGWQFFQQNNSQNTITSNSQTPTSKSSKKTINIDSTSTNKEKSSERKNTEAPNQEKENKLITSPELKKIETPLNKAAQTNESNPLKEITNSYKNQLNVVNHRLVTSCEAFS